VVPSFSLKREAFRSSLISLSCEFSPILQAFFGVGQLFCSSGRDYGDSMGTREGSFGDFLKTRVGAKLVGTNAGTKAEPEALR